MTLLVSTNSTTGGKKYQCPEVIISKGECKEKFPFCNFDMANTKVKCSKIK